MPGISISAPHKIGGSQPKARRSEKEQKFARLYTPKLKAT
jgi:hypothetical protein